MTHVACPTCLGEWERGHRVPEGTTRVPIDAPEAFCCHCGAYCSPAATTLLGKHGCEEDHDPCGEPPETST